MFVIFLHLNGFSTTKKYTNKSQSDNFYSFHSSENNSNVKKIKIILKITKKFD